MTAARVLLLTNSLRRGTGGKFPPRKGTYQGERVEGAGNEPNAFTEAGSGWRYLTETL